MVRILIALLLMTGIAHADVVGIGRSITMKGLVGGSTSTAIEIDGSTHALKVILYEHAEVHSGSHYTFSASNGDLDAAATLDFIITTPDTTKWAHMVGSVYGALHTRFEMFEDTTHTTNVAQSIFNNNRNSVNTSGLTIHTSNDDVADGTLIFETEFGIDTGSGTNKRSGGGEARADSEWILKQNTKYLFRIESQTANNVVNLVLGWYEHTNAL